MYFYTTQASADGDDPVRRLIGDGSPVWMAECACCLCGCLSTGPLFIVVGMLFLVRPRGVGLGRALARRSTAAVLTRPAQLTAATDPRRDGIREYNRDVRCAPPAVILARCARAPLRGAGGASPNLKPLMALPSLHAHGPSKPSET